MQEIFLLEDLLNVLIELEGLGNVHYKILSEMTEHLELKRLFLKLSEEESRHKEIYIDYKSRMINFVNNTVTNEYKEYLNALLENTMAFLKSNGSFDGFDAGYLIAIRLEKETLLFLSEMKQIINGAYHDDMDILMDQERQHLKFLLGYKKEI